MGTITFGSALEDESTMGKRISFMGQRQVGIREFDNPSLQPGQVRLKTLYSGISAGTELTGYRGTAPFMNKRFDSQYHIFRPDETGLQYPCDFGYEEVGQVIEVGSAVTDVPLGAHIFGAWSHCSHAVVEADYARQRILPAGLDPVIGIFSQIGAVALNGVHDGAIRVGETVAVFGLGVLGQIVAQAARLSGATVIAVDLHDSRLALARSLGAHITLNPLRDQVAETIKEKLTAGRGADVCIEVSGAYPALHEAIRAAAYSARVVAMGFFQGESKGMFLGEEFHHNRINVVCSQIFGTNPDLTYRWTDLRLAQTTMRLAAENQLQLKPLISHLKPAEQAADLFQMLDTAPESIMQAVLDFTGMEG
jgi:2-desacetyl-2-hydroxyethyl bacteriochlorophyllide A dehydrogenase